LSIAEIIGVREGTVLQDMTGYRPAEVEMRRRKVKNVQNI